MIHQYYIATIYANGQAFRFSSGGDVTVNGLFYADGLNVNTISSEEARLTIPNIANTASQLFLNYPVKDTTFSISHVSDEVREVFNGFGDNLIRLDAESAQVRAIANASYSYFSDKRVEPPDFNHITPDGTVITFGSSTITIGN